MLTAVGNTVEDTWKNIVAGKSGIAPITAFDTTDFPVKISGSVKDFDATKYIPMKDLKKMDPFIHFGIAAGFQALEDSGLKINSTNANRIGVVTGCGLGGLGIMEATILNVATKGPKRVSPFFIPMMIGNMAPGMISIHFGAKVFSEQQKKNFLPIRFCFYQ